jgi:drug/metabolite transporter (DMT)-like permease
MSPYVLALLAALAFALGSALQQRGTLDTEAGEGDPRFLLQILRKRVWLAGAGLQGVGWLLQALALEAGSLVIVQSLITLNLVFALPLGAWLTAQRVSRRAVAGALATLTGIVGFIAVGDPQPGTITPDAATLAVWGGLAAAAMVVLASLAVRRRGPVAATLFATSGGIGYGLQAAATKVFVAQLGGGLAAILGMLATYVLIVSALVGFALQQSALKTGFLAPAMAAGSATTLVTSVLLGVVLFGESIADGGAQLPVALGALGLAVVGVVVLAIPEARETKRSASRQ